jgi:hypothetical protein
MITVAPDGHRLLRAGRPWFWMADTAWYLLWRLTPTEQEQYLDARRRQGFTAIQFSVVAERFGLDVVGAPGCLPFRHRDPAQIEPQYLAALVRLIDACLARDLVPIINPMWGDTWSRRWNDGSNVVFDPARAAAYAGHLGRALAGRELVWLLGGDRGVEQLAHRAIFDAFAAGLHAAGAHQPIAFHPQFGLCATDALPDAPWLAISTCQSSHITRQRATWEMIEGDRGRQPARPVLDAEPCYEDHPVMTPAWRWRAEDGHFGAHEVRRAAWWAVLAGAAGHTYGHHSIWQCWAPPHEPINRPLCFWTQALDAPGALAMGHLAAFIAALPDRPWSGAQARVLDQSSEPLERVSAASDGTTWLAAYLPYPRQVRLDTSGLAAASFHAAWLDPRTGARSDLGAQSNTGAWTSPWPPTGPDQVLLLTVRSG